MDLVEAGLEAGPDLLDLVLYALFILLELLLVEEAGHLRLHVKLVQVDIVLRLGLIRILVLGVRLQLGDQLCVRQVKGCIGRGAILNS